jgi:anti-sigma factor RsiW
MADCRDLESLFAPYVDGEAQSQTCAEIAAHLEACPKCRDRVAAERAVHEALATQRARLRACASAELRRRCEAGCRSPSPAAKGLFSRPSILKRSGWLPLSMAATLLLAVAGVFLYGLKGGGEALAAQLVVDHVKCFEFAPQPSIIPEGRALSREWSTARGWTIKIPESKPDEGLELLGVRRCLSMEGLTAHVMYKWRGQPLSVYVLNSERTRLGPAPQLVERFGQEAIMWSRGGRTYAVVTNSQPSEIEQVARYVQIAAE